MEEAVSKKKVLYYTIHIEICYSYAEYEATQEIFVPIQSLSSWFSLLPWEVIFSSFIAEIEFSPVCQPLLVKLLCFWVLLGTMSWPGYFWMTTVLNRPIIATLLQNRADRNETVLFVKKHWAVLIWILKNITYHNTWILPSGWIQMQVKWNLIASLHIAAR